MADHASRLIAELIGEAVVAAIERGRRHSAERLRATLLWFREIAEAPPGIELLAPDGSLFTGLVLVERSRALYLLALRHSPRRPSEVPRRADEPLFREEHEPWRERNGCSFRR